MSRLKLSIVLGALTVGLIALPVFAQSTDATPSSAQSSASSQSTPTSSSQSAAQDQSNPDDQDRAKQYEGKTVKVTGSLDSSSNTIRVASIEPGS